MGSPDVSLAYALWFHFCLPRAAILLAWLICGTYLHLPPVLLYLLLAADLALFLSQSFGFQRRVDSHVAGYGGMAPVWGGYLVLLFAGFVTATLWWGAILMAHRPGPTEPFSARMDRLRASSYVLTLSQDGTKLRFDGTITFGLTRRATELANRAPQLGTVILTSTGGHIYEARGLARLIGDRGLDTHVIGECSSACTLPFIAGSHRSLARGARLGFHQYGLEDGNTLPHLDLSGEQDQDRARFRGQGVSDAFLRRMFDQPRQGIWFPSITELLTARLITPD